MVVMTRFLDFNAVKRRPRPNSCLVAPEGFCPTGLTDEIAPVIPVPPKALFERLCTYAQTQSLWQDQATDETTLQFRCVARTRLMRFADDVDIQVLPAPQPDHSTLAIFSRSRVGYSDLGTNARRVGTILAHLTSK
ncbi:MAG: DUF1499 domain-containing protein [Henriciella sp.]|jgi:uncharacterized protein (DUF1499 family)